MGHAAPPPRRQPPPATCVTHCPRRPPTCLAGRNRVLHVATSSGGQVVGCCSSTLFAPWCEPGCGHWGLLAVRVSHQGGGVATALVEAAERRLATEGPPNPHPHPHPHPHLSLNVTLTLH